jgi:ribonuclease HI
MKTTTQKKIVDKQDTTTKTQEGGKDDSIIVFTDGSYVPQKFASYSVVFPFFKQYNSCTKLTGKLTNNRAEFSAMIKALEVVDTIDKSKKRNLIVCTDSELLVNTVSKWMLKWKRNGWRKYDNEPVKNLDLVKRLDALVSKRKVVMRHVRAHTGKKDFYSVWNDVADRLAKSCLTRKY